MFYNLLKTKYSKLIFALLKSGFLVDPLCSIVSRRYSAKRYRSSQVALVQMPGWGVDTPPLSIGYLAAYLRKYNFRVMPVDINIDMYLRNKRRYKNGWLLDVDNFWTNHSIVEDFIVHNKKILDAYLRKIIGSGARIIGFSVYNSSYLMSCYMAKQIKEAARDRIIIFGGPDVSEFISGKQTLVNNPCIDFVVNGEGEETLLDIVSKIFSSGEVTDCSGAAYRLKGEIVTGSQREVIKNLDALPFPDFSDFEFLLYKNPFAIPISSSRGCVNRCIYCNDRPFWREYRSRSGESLFKEVKYQIKEHPQVSTFYFQDSLVNGNIKALERFCDLIINEKTRIQWLGQAIIRKGMNYGFFVKLKKSGCVNLAYGLESASPSLRERIGKVFSIGVDVEQMVADSKKAGVGCGINFMFGLPGETEEDAEKNIDFVMKNEDKIDTINPSFSFCVLCPGTPAYGNPGEYGVDLSKGPVYWQSIDGKNNFLKRLERFERFIGIVRKLKTRTTYSLPKLPNRNELIANYYFAMGDYKKAIPYYEDSLKYEINNKNNINKLNICRSNIGKAESMISCQ